MSGKMAKLQRLTPPMQIMATDRALFVGGQKEHRRIMLLCIIHRVIQRTSFAFEADWFHLNCTMESDSPIKI